MKRMPPARALHRSSRSSWPASLGALRRLASRRGFVRVPRVSELETYRPDIITEIRARRRLDDRAVRRSSGASWSREPTSRRSSRTRSSRPRTRTSSATAASTCAARSRRSSPNVRRQRYAQGGSTLTQQLARAIFLSPRKTLSRKINEALVAFEIERRYSKDQILTMYANEIYLGHGNYGFEAASRYYFGKSVKNLTLAEAALLAGIIQRPEDQSPFRNPEPRAAAALDGAAPDGRGRGYITEARAPGRRAPSRFPSAPALQETVVAPYFCEEIRQYLEKTYGEKDLYRRGLRVDSTLDPELQAFSEEALGWGLRRLARRHGFRKPRNLLAEGYADLGAYVDPAWESATLAEGDTAARRRRRTSRRPAPRSASATQTLPAAALRLRLDGRDAGRPKILQARRPRHRHVREGEGRRRAHARAGAARAGRGPDPRELDGRDPRDGRRLRLDAQSKFNRADAGAAAGRLDVQAVRLPRRAGDRATRPSDTIFDGPISIVDRSAPAALPAASTTTRSSAAS